MQTWIKCQTTVLGMNLEFLDTKFSELYKIHVTQFVAHTLNTNDMLFLLTYEIKESQLMQLDF